MLPDTASITQNEESTRILGLRVWDVGEGLAERWAGVVLVPANAACNFLLIYSLLVWIIYRLCALPWTVVFQ
jgi:hypothetical protein